MSEAHHAHEPAGPAARTAALERLMTSKGLVDTSFIDNVVETYTEQVGPRNGARVVARAWVDPDYRARLLSDGKSAISELGYSGPEGDVVVVENAPDVHNVVVCTLCSCYPWSVLGLPPRWYKSFEYRARMVREPRTVLNEMGLDVPEQVQIQVWDSSAEKRYLVLPERPAGTDGLDEDALAELVTRDSMIGVSRL
jgi:nitrile hydratase